MGQVIFDPLGYTGGIDLGLGYGEKAKVGLVVDKENNVVIGHYLLVNGGLHIELSISFFCINLL